MMLIKNSVGTNLTLFNDLNRVAYFTLSFTSLRKVLAGLKAGML